VSVRHQLDPVTLPGQRAQVLADYVGQRRGEAIQPHRQPLGTDLICSGLDEASHAAGAEIEKSPQRSQVGIGQVRRWHAEQGLNEPRRTLRLRKHPPDALAHGLQVEPLGRGNAAAVVAKARQQAGRVGGGRGIADAVQEHPIVAAAPHDVAQVVLHGLTYRGTVRADERKLWQPAEAWHRLAVEANGLPLGPGHERAITGEQRVPAEELGACAGRFLAAGRDHGTGQVPAQKDVRDRQTRERGAQPGACVAGVNLGDARAILQILNSDCVHITSCQWHPHERRITSSVGSSTSGSAWPVRMSCASWQAAS
jgi:hypothetical protein